MLNIKTDSRKVKKGDIFVAVKCELNDGHSYIKSAIDNGATTIVVDHGDYNYDNVNVIKVDNTRDYLEKYLTDHYSKFLNEMTLIAYTGTNGKTTSCFFLYQLLNKLNIKTGYIGTIGFYLEDKVCSLPNTSVDICEAYDLLITAYDKGYKTVVMETSSQALDSNRLNTLYFDYGVFTNLTRDHLDYHKTMENYAMAKQKLFKKLRNHKYAIINSDDNFKNVFTLKDNDNITYGMNTGDYKVTDLKIDHSGSTFTLEYDNVKTTMKTNVIGKYNIYNLLSVICILKTMNISDDLIAKEISNLQTPSGRMQKIPYKNNNTIIIDYAHTPDGLENFISTVSQFITGDIYVVFGCTGSRDREKRPIMTTIVGSYAKKFIITNDDLHDEEPEDIVKDMLKDNKYDQYEICLDREKAIIKGINLLNKNDALLILGKGHEEFMIVKNKKIPFSDYKVVTEYIKNN